MSKVPLSLQIEAVEIVADSFPDNKSLSAALATLKLFQKYEPEVRDLLNLCIKRDEVLPGSRIEVPAR
jgi:hypothetical protein